MQNNAMHAELRWLVFHTLQRRSPQPGDRCRYLATQMDHEQNLLHPPRFAQRSFRLRLQAIERILIFLCATIAFALTLVLFAGVFKPAQYGFSIAHRLNIFIYPYGWHQDIAIANYPYTSLIDMKEVLHRRRFDAFGIHIHSLEWSDFSARSIRLHLMYPIVLFALPLACAGYRRVRESRAK